MLISFFSIKLIFQQKLSNKDFNALVKLHLSENIYTSASTLLSLSKLIDSLPNMVVLDHISELVQASVEQLNKVFPSITTVVMANPHRLMTG